MNIEKTGFPVSNTIRGCVNVLASTRKGGGGVTMVPLYVATFTRGHLSYNATILEETSLYLHVIYPSHEATH